MCISIQLWDRLSLASEHKTAQSVCILIQCFGSYLSDRSVDHFNCSRFVRKREKLRCLLHYFYRVTEVMPTGAITFTRRKLGDRVPDWANSMHSFDQFGLHVNASGTIESSGSRTIHVSHLSAYILKSLKKTFHWMCSMVTPKFTSVNTLWTFRLLEQNTRGSEDGFLPTTWFAVSSSLITIFRKLPVLVELKNCTERSISVFFCWYFYKTWVLKTGIAAFAPLTSILNHASQGISPSRVISC